MMRSLKKQDIRTPDEDPGFWVIEQKAGNVNWQEINSLVRPGVVRLFTYQLLSRGVFCRCQQLLVIKVACCPYPLSLGFPAHAQFLQFQRALDSWLTGNCSDFYLCWLIFLIGIAN